LAARSVVLARLLDLLALLIVAFLLLLPQPTVTFSPGFVGDKSDLDRIAVLEDALFRKPGDVEPAVELARAYLRAFCEDLALPSSVRGPGLLFDIV